METKTFEVINSVPGSQRLWRKGWFLFSLQLIAHLSIIPMLIYGELHHYLIAALVYFLTGCLGMSITYHRLWSHKSWRPPVWFQYVGTFFGCVGLTGSPLAWIAIHRAHHASTDKLADPHSPVHQSFFRVQFLSMFRKPNLLLVRDLTQKPVLKFFHRNYLMINFTVATILFLIDPFAVVYAYLFPAAILWNAGSLINNIGHRWGYRNYNTTDQSKNNTLLGIFMWGEGWHNNHHRYPTRAKFASKPFELDISYMIISLLNKK